MRRLSQSKMFLFFLQNVLSGCCDISYNSQIKSTYGDANGYTDIKPHDDCKYAIDDVLCNGPSSTEYKKRSKQCLYNLLCNKNQDISVCKEDKKSMKQIYYELKFFLTSYYQSDKLTFQLFYQIWMYFRGDCHKIVVFFTHAIHNTSGFKNLTGWKKPEYGKYYSRGILQILGEENYKLAGLKFLYNPGLLANLDFDAVCASLNVYSVRVNTSAQSTLCDSWYYLNPEEIQGKNYTYDYYQERITNRLNLYIQLTFIFCIKPKFGSCCYFLQRYIPQISRSYPLVY